MIGLVSNWIQNLKSSSKVHCINSKTEEDEKFTSCISVNGSWYFDVHVCTGRHSTHPTVPGEFDLTGNFQSYYVGSLWCLLQIVC